MGDNVRIKVSRRRFGNLSDGRKGEKNAKYMPPTAVVTVFALEEGFATSADLQGQSKTPENNQPTPAGQFDNGFNWGSDNSWQ